MQRRDVFLSIAGALILVLLVGFAPWVIPFPIREYVLGPALEFWYLGVAATIVSIILRRNSAWRTLSRVLGVIGVIWVAFFVAFYLLVALIFTLFPIGY